MNRATIFAAFRAARPRLFDDPAWIEIIDGICDDAGIPRDAAKRTLADPPAFFTALREVTGPLDQQQVDTINGLVAAAAHWPIGWLAYGLATAYHEARFKPIEEYGKGKGKPYGKPGKHGQAQYGRGLVQLTWDANYERADRELGLGGKLLDDFGLALHPDIAAAIMIRGMEEGWFTGRKLADYITERGSLDTFRQARRIINGMDRADLIAGQAVYFQNALDKGGWR